MTGPTGNNQYINKPSPVGHINDVHYGKATVCFDQMRKCWRLPGGDSVENQEIALRKANIINQIMCGG